MPTDNTAFYEKAAKAWEVVNGCIGPKGVWASPTRYQYQCWTRDFVLATQDLLMEQGRTDIVATHLEELGKRQYADGRIPIMFVDHPLKLLWQKLAASIKNRRMSFILRRYFSKDGIGQLTPWTKDSEILYMLGVAKAYTSGKFGGADARKLFDSTSRVNDARRYIQTSLGTEANLVHGGDWRDTRLDLGDKFLLTNNCLWYEAHNLVYRQNSYLIKEEINKQFWTGTHYRDYLGVDDFDTLGNALAILYDVAPKERWSSIFNEAEKLDTPYGYKLNGVTLPPKSPEETAVMERTNQFGVIWPFIHGFMILALVKAGMKEKALEQYEKWTALDGLYEFYDPLTGRGHGSTDQVWSAALYIRAGKALGIL